LEARRSALGSLRQALTRMQAQQQQLRTRAEQIAQQLQQTQSPQDDLDRSRQTLLDQRVLVDKDLAAARQALDAGEAEFRRLEQTRHRVERQVGELREGISQARMRVQAAQLRAEALAQDVAEAGFDRTELLNGLPDDADPGVWASAIDDLEGKIRRLEPVNLAAIQEFEEQGKRKEYLDRQNDDLTAALETLENAIRKIDRETRS